LVFFFIPDFSLKYSSYEHIQVVEIIKLQKYSSYLLRKPRTEEWHVVGIGVRVDCAERISTYDSQNGEDSSRQLRANWNSDKKI
jgi:hypothetical protein